MHFPGPLPFEDLQLTFAILKEIWEIISILNLYNLLECSMARRRGVKFRLKFSQALQKSGGNLLPRNFFSPRC
jgi:hypothetical protein